MEHSPHAVGEGPAQDQRQGAHRQQHQQQSGCRHDARGVAQGGAPVGGTVHPAQRSPEHRQVAAARPQRADGTRPQQGPPGRTTAERLLQDAVHLRTGLTRHQPGQVCRRVPGDGRADLREADDRGQQCRKDRQDRVVRQGRREVGDVVVPHPQRCAPQSRLPPFVATHRPNHRAPPHTQETDGVRSAAATAFPPRALRNRLAGPTAVVPGRRRRPTRVIAGSDAGTRRRAAGSGRVNGTRRQWPVPWSGAVVWCRGLVPCCAMRQSGPRHEG